MMARRLPLYLLLDTSGSMNGEPIQALNNGVSVLINMLRADPMAIDTVWVSIITFDRHVKEIIPLTPIDELQLPDIECVTSGPTMTGQALSLLHEKVLQNTVRTTKEQKGDWKPILVLFTDGKASDVQCYNDILPKVNALPFASKLICAAGNLSNMAQLQQLSNDIMQLDEIDSSSLQKFFVWVSELVDRNSRSAGQTPSNEPVPAIPPPPSINHVVV